MQGVILLLTSTIYCVKILTARNKKDELCCCFPFEKKEGIMKKIRCMALLLVLLMLAAAFAACKKDNIEEQSNASESSEISEVSEVSEVSELPERIDGTELYKEALEKFEDAENFEVNASYERTVTVGTETRKDAGTSTGFYLGYGTKDMKYYSEYETVYGNKRTVKTEETMIDGTTFLLYDGNGFYGPAESDYSVFLPEYELYDDITELSEKDKNGNTVVILTNAEETETHFAYEYAVLEEAGAEVHIDEEGNIVSIAYSAKYEQGAAHFEINYSYTIAPINSTLPEIEAPENVKDYLEVDSVLAVMLMDEALMYMQDIGTYSYNSTAYMYAAGVTIQSTIAEYTSFEYEEDFAASMNMSKQSVWIDFDRNKQREETVENQTTVIDGVEISEINGNKNERELTEEEIESFRKGHLDTVMYGVPDISDIKDIEYSSIDGYVTVTVQCRNAHGEELYESMSGILNEFDYIEDASDDFDCEKIEFVITIDMDTTYPVAINVDYEGIFEIDGYEYEMGLERNMSINPANPDSYFDITEKHHPAFDKEPDEEDEATPLFYKVTDANGNVMWLLGTIHVGDNRTAYLPEEIYDAFDEADAVAFEINLLALNEEFEDLDDDLLDLYSEAYFYENGSIEKEIDETLYRDASELASALGLGNYGDYICTLEYAKPNMWAGMINNTYLAHTLGVYYNKGVDMRLLTRASEAEKKIYDIEDRYRQFQMDIDFSDDVHELNLYNAVYYPRSYYRADNIELFDAWCRGDYKELSELVNVPADFTGMSDEQIAAYEEYDKALCTERDALMLEKAKEYIASGETVFFSVGLAHLLDEDTGLLKTLEDAGYTVELIEYK